MYICAFVSIFQYICIRIFLCIYVYTDFTYAYIYTCSHVYIYVCICAYMYLRTYIHIHMSIYINIHIYIHISLHLYMNITFMYICIWKHTRRYKYMHIYIYMLHATRPVLHRLGVGPLSQGAMWTSNKHVVIPRWAVGCRNRRIPTIPKIFPECRSTEIQR